MTRSSDGAGRKWVTPEDSPRAVTRHVRTLLRQEGLAGAVAGAGRFLATLLRSVYSQEQVRLYRMPLAEAAAMPVTMPPENASLHIIESREDALKLAALGFDNILEAAPRAEHKLKCGAVAACAFLGHELASIDWIALSETARLVVDRVPYPIDFAAGEACTGGAFTIRRLRGRGLAAYRFSIQVSYLHARGFRVCYSRIADDNIPSQRTVERYGATYDLVYRHRRLLGHDSYTTIGPKSTAIPAQKQS